jgi:hypothetical protein
MGTRGTEFEVMERPETLAVETLRRYYRSCFVSVLFVIVVGSSSGDHTKSS